MLTSKMRKRIDNAAKHVKRGDLFHALHHLGDDATKLDIGLMLKGALDRDAYRKVVAVFKLCTADVENHWIDEGGEG